LVGGLDEALAKWERAAAIMRASGADEFWFSIGRAQVLRAKGDAARALEDDTHALRAAEQIGADSMQSAEALNAEGLDLLALGRPGDAMEALERALAVREKGIVRPDFLAETRFALARALASSGGDMERARRLAEAARTGLSPDADAYGSFYAAARSEID